MHGRRHSSAAPGTAMALLVVAVVLACLFRPLAAWCDVDVRCDWNYDVGTFTEVNSTSPEVANAKLVPAPRGAFLVARAAGDVAENATVFLRSPRYSGTESPRCRLAIKARLLDARITAFVVLLNDSDARPLHIETLAAQQEPPWDTFQAEVGHRIEKFQLVVQLSLSGDASYAIIKQIYYENCVNGFEDAACDFEQGLCQWTKSTNNRPEFDWQRTSGATKPKGNSFPSNDTTYGNGSGYYLYVSPEKDKLGQRADLIGPVLPAPSTSACKILFSFYVRGFGMFPANLHVYHTDIESGKGSDLASFDSSKRWSEAQVSIPRGTNKYRLTLAVRSGMKSGGVIAIDNIRFSPWCFEGPKVLQQYMTYKGLQTLQKNAGDQSTYRFTTCGAFGRNGPAMRNCDATYRGTGSNVVLRSDADAQPGFQVWAVPVTDTYVLNAVGARGGFGANSMQQQLLAAEQLQAAAAAEQSATAADQSDPFLGILSNRWADRATAYANLTQGDLLYISVGQAGRPACQAVAGKMAAVEAQLMCSTSKDGGGGGGGGGATFVFVQRKGSDNISLLVVAAGGGGLGRELPPADFNVSQAYSCGPAGSSSATPCVTKQQPQRPGNGKLAVPEGSEPPSVWPRKSWRADLAGGWGCSDRLRRQPVNGSVAAAAAQDTAVGGFGGGGGGCRAGGGGGGYPGGLASPYNDPRAPGLAGSSYVNPALAALIFIEKNEDSRTSLDGAFELFRKPPPCPCEDVCNWLDLNFTSYRCMCSTDSWKLAEDGRRCIPATGPPEVVVGAIASEDGRGGRLSFVEIAIITVSLAAAAVVVACVIACRSVRRQWKPKRKGGGGMRALINDPTLTSLQHPPETLVNSLSPNLLYEFTCFSNFGNLPQISRDNLLLVKALGQGAFGEVFEGILSLGDRWDSKSVSVAVKTSSAVLSAEQAEVDFLMEALIVSKFNHPNIVKFLGVCWDSCPRYIVLELLAGGDLRSFLREQRPTEVQQTSKLTVGDMVKLSLDVAYACHHLEQNHFIHRDIAARNCLLTETGPGRVAKIADFGMARDIYRADYYRKGGRALLPVKWMPPEAFMDGVFTTKTDVWSFGVLLWEIFSMGYMPYPGISNREVVEFVMRGGRMEPPRHAPASIQNLMKLCWLQHSDKRPTFASAVKVLERCLEDAAAAPSQCIAATDLAQYGGGSCKTGQDCQAAAAGHFPEDGAAAAATAIAASVTSAAAAAASGQLREPSVRFSGTTLSSDDGDSGMLEAIDSPGAASCEPLLSGQLLFDSFRLATPTGSLPPPPPPSADATV